MNVLISRFFISKQYYRRLAHTGKKPGKKTSTERFLLKMKNLQEESSEEGMFELDTSSSEVATVDVIDASQPFDLQTSSSTSPSMAGRIVEIEVQEGAEPVFVKFSDCSDEVY